MIVTTAAPPGVRRLAATLYGYAFLQDLVLFYPVYALLFSDTGLSIGQISSLFVVWSATSILLEVPSGAWADAVSRRLLLCLAPLLAGAGYALWVLAPSYPAFALGFVLWGAGGALGSGTLEALVFTELDRLGAAGRYARTMGRARTAAVLGVLASIVLAGPVLAVGGYPAVGAASVLATLLAAAVATRFPEHRPDPAAASEPAEEGDDLGWAATLRAGLAEARADPRVRGALLLVPAVAAVWGALEEYTPLLARDTGVAEPTVPLLLLLVSAGVTVGGLLAAPAERLGTRGYAALLTVAAVALAAGAGLRHPAGFVLVGVAFCAFQLATVLADARLQARITGPGRATVTSVAGMATDLTIIAVYGGYALVAAVGGNRAAFVVAAVPYLLVAVVLLASRDGRRGGAPREPVAGRSSGPT
ncbi:Predicted arabinose efflux permease, MFS family [Micromonospora purpureochromogenes]|uniref:Predicted arabinose efflux permease, MFS family n=1 Tax=Micromonospora purpureochromogenes TaxID=47872 RepID=A0A1C4YLS6_9ACTN|nr:MFS transporter [Micromonospora purpureochromogenes]SCF21617.1 Predicted arabinose efflux permease, MFS family [Micromonospora purpureochromogenes]